MTPSISYRSPLGTVLAFDQFGAEVVRLEPGAEAEAEWERMQTSGVPCHDGAAWIDKQGADDEGNR